MADTHSHRTSSRKPRTAAAPAVRPAAPAAGQQPLFAILKPAKPAPAEFVLQPQTLALAEMHHDLVFSVTYPQGVVTDLSASALHRLGRERDEIVGRSLGEVLGVADLAAYLKDLPPGRPVRWTQRLALGGEPAAIWDFRAARPTASENEAILLLHSQEERRQAQTAPGSAPSLETLPAAEMESAAAGTPQPLMIWIRSAVQAACAGLYYIHRETGRLSLAYEADFPWQAPREWPATDVAGRASPTLWRGETDDADDFSVWAGAAGIHSAVVLGLPDFPAEGALVLGWHEPEPPAGLSSVLAAFAGAHAALMREWQARAQLQEIQQKGRRSESALRAVMDELPQALIIVRARNERVSETSLSCERMLGYSAAALALMKLEDWLTAPEAVVTVRAACESGRINESGELTLYRRDGEGFPSLVRAIPLRAGPGGEFQEVLVVLTDLTSSRDARLEARHLQRQAVLGWMAASFAHEIRNPLNNLSLQLEEMRTLYSLPPEVANLAAEAKAECGRLTEISRRMLDFARGQDFHPAPTDMVALVKRVLQRMSPALERAGVQSLLSAPPDLPSAMADPLSIEQVILNLIDNAAKAMSEGGHLGVSLQLSALESGAPAVEVRVADTGQGLPPQVRDKLFQPYVTTRADGHGLGLALSRHILDAHRGALRAETFPGSGTVFHVLLPVAETT